MSLLKRIFCFSICLQNTLLHAQSENFRFSNYTQLQGLSSSNTTCMHKDSRGFLWIGTTDGLNLFDGYTFKIFRHNRFDSLSLPGNFINSIAEDSSGWLWIGTHEGIAQMNPLDGRCQIYKHRDGDRSSLISNYDSRVFTDQEHRIWICNSEAISQFIPKTKNFLVLFTKKNLGGGFGSFCEENSNSVWFGSYDGLVHFIPSERSWNIYTIASNPKTVTTINCIFIDHRGTLWCGTWGKGLCRFDRESKTFTSYRWDLSPANPSIVNVVTSILETVDHQQQHRLFVGTGQGLLVLNNESFPTTLEKIPFITHDATNPESIAGDYISQIIEDQQHIIWFCANGGVSCIVPVQQIFHIIRNGVKGQMTKILPIDSSIYITSWYGNGLTICDQNGKVKKEFLRLPPTSPSLDNGQVSDMIRDESGQYWFATFNGLVRSNASLTQFEVFMHDEKDSNSISGSRVTSVVEDTHHRIWAGTYKAGLNRFDPVTNRFTRFYHDQKNNHSLADDLVWLLRKDHSGNIWVGTNNGWCYFDEMKNLFNPCSSPAEGAIVRDMYEDESGMMWIGSGRGLNKLNPLTCQTEFYSTEEGMASYSVQGIIADDEGNLWLGTDAGISRFNPQKKFFTNYSVKNGLPNLPLYSVFYKDGSGKIYEGVKDGFLVFNPRELNQPLKAPPVYIAEMKIGNQPVSAEALQTNSTLQLCHLCFTQFRRLHFSCESNECRWHDE